MSATRKAKKPGSRKPVDLIKSVEALADFQDDPKVQGHHPDSELKGLFLHVGPRSMVWRYRRQRMKNGVRKMVFKSLGNRSRQITQVEQYAYTISDDERFRHPNTRWSFWVISNDIDAFAKIKS